MKNKLILNFLLSAMTVSLSTFFAPLSDKDIDKKNEIISLQDIEIIDFKMPIYSSPERQIEVKEIIINEETKLSDMNMALESISNIEEKEKWFLAYKDIINLYSDIFDPPETIYDCFSNDELNLLFHVVQAEIGDEYSFEQKVNVASVIFNRIEHCRFPDTLGEILVASQFSSISDGRYQKVEVSDTTVLACEYAFSIENTAEECLFFDSNNKLNYQFAFADGAHNFYKLNEK